MTDLEILRQKYTFNLEEDPFFSFRDAFKNEITRKKQSLVDLTVVAANLSPQVFWSDDALDPLVLRALNETNPNFDSAMLANYSDDQLLGIVNSAKGKYFEYLVENKLNSGGIVGDVVLPSGFYAEVALSPTQPGWDIQILDQEGNVADYLQLKATNSISYIHETLEKYPDITILGTSEIADKANGLILDSNISEHELAGQVSTVMNDLDPDFISELLDAFNPILPLLFVLATEGYSVYVGKSSIENLHKNIQCRAARTLTASGIGSIVYAMGGGWLSIPSVFIAGVLYDGYQDGSLVNYNFEQKISDLGVYRDYQKLQIRRMECN